MVRRRPARTGPGSVRRLGAVPRPEGLWPALAVLAVAAVLLPVAVVTGWPIVVVLLALCTVVLVRHASAAPMVVLGIVTVSAVVVLVDSAGPEHVRAYALVWAAAAGLGWWWRTEVLALADRVAEAERRTARVSVLDDTTGCVNRQGFELLAGHVLQQVRRRGDAAYTAAVHVGPSGPGQDAHPVSPELFAAVAHALRSTTRATDVVARWSDDRFLVMGPGNGTAPGELERRVRLALADDSPDVPSWPCRLVAGVGVLEPWDAGALSDLLARAEEDLMLRRSLHSPSAPEPRG